MSIILQYAAVLVGAVSLAGGWALLEYPSVGIFMIVTGAIWLYGLYRKYTWISGVGLALYVFLAMLGLWFKFNPWLALTVVLCALLVWDMDYFNRRFHLASDLGDRHRLFRQHLLRLGVVIIPSVLVFWFVQDGEIKVSFEGAVALALLAIFGISALVYRLRSEA